MNNSSRRRFLKIGSQTIAGAGLALGVNPLLTQANAADTPLSDSADYRALVCVYLEGGSDGFSLLVPSENALYNEYATARQNLAVPQNQLLEINSVSGNTPAMGFHSSAAPLQTLFEDQRLAMIANIGNLIEPTTKDQYENNAVALPAQLFSHADQEIQWQQLQGRDRGTHGWGARAADYLADFQERDYLTSITLAGSNYWQSGLGQRPFSLKETGVLEYAGMDMSNEWERPRAEAFKRVMAMQQNHLFSSAYAEVQNRAMSITAELGAALHNNSTMIPEQPTENGLAARLGMVAQLIAAREQLGMRRQIFYVRMGGFDVHDNQNKQIPELFGELSDALAFFQNALDQMGQSNNVVTFTASDFGRTLTGNGNGTDHGWGNHLLVMGGAVNGGEIYGKIPSMNINGPDSVHNGRILPTLSASQYAATLLRWLGLDDQQLANTLPNLSNFSQHDLGFLV